MGEEPFFGLFEEEMTMNTFYRRKLFSLANIAAVVLMSLGVGLSPSAFAEASYRGDLRFSLLMPGAKTNLFGFGGPTSYFAPPMNLFLDNATAFARRGDATTSLVPIVPPPADGSDVRVKKSVENVKVYGTAGPGNGYSYAESKGALFARLGNLSGSGAGIPAPPGQIFNAVFDLSFEYNLTTAIANPLLEDAQARVGLYVRAKPEIGGDWTTYFSVSDWISGTLGVNGLGNAQFTIPLAQNSITLFETQFFLNGQAISIAEPPLPPIPPIITPAPVPEPVTLVLVSTGIMLMGLARQRTNRRRKEPSFQTIEEKLTPA